jgi:hypothetical protein
MLRRRLATWRRARRWRSFVWPSACCGGLSCIPVNGPLSNNHSLFIINIVQCPNMPSLKKAAMSLSSNKVHPSNSQDADSEMVDQPRRRRQSFSTSVVADDSGSARGTPIPRSSSPASFRRRSLSNGSIGVDTGSLAEQQDGRNTTRRFSVEDDLQKKPQIKRNSVDDDFITPAPRKIAEQVQSLALQRFFSSAQESNSWSASTKKMIFGSDIDDSNLQNRTKLETR